MSEPRRIVMLATHRNPHLEELAIVWLIVSGYFKGVVEQLYPGAAEAGFVRWDDLPAGTTKQYWEEQGYLLFGRWGSEFDEHPYGDEPRKEGESALSLVAKRLGIENDPNFVQMARWISHLDLHVGRSQFHLGACVKMLTEFGDGNPDTVMQWTFVALETLYRSGARFFTGPTALSGKYWGYLYREWMLSHFSGRVSLKDLDTVRKLKDPAEVASGLTVRNRPALERLLEFTMERWEKPSGSSFEPHMIAEAIFNRLGANIAKEWAFQLLDALHKQAEDYLLVKFDYQKASKYSMMMGSRKINIVAGKSRSRQLSRYARSAPPKGCWAAIVISIDENGNVAITTNHASMIDLSPVAAGLRVAEFEARGLPAPSDPALLRRENELPGGDVWYFFPRGRMILNGSTTKTMPPTVLGLETIVAIIFAALGLKPIPQAPRLAVALQPLVTAPATA